MAHDIEHMEILNKATAWQGRFDLVKRVTMYYRHPEKPRSQVVNLLKNEATWRHQHEWFSRT